MLHDAGHGGDRARLGQALLDEHREDHLGRGQLGLLDQAADGWRAA
jgi:hypothetical protein